MAAIKEKWIGQKEVGENIGLTSRQVHNLADAGVISRRVENGRAEYPWPKVNHEYINWKITEAEKRARPNEFEAHRARKIANENALLELDLAKARGELVPVSAVRETWRGGLATIRAQLMSVPGRYSPRTVGIASLPESQRVWDAAIRDVMTELRDGDSAR